MSPLEKLKEEIDLCLQLHEDEEISSSVEGTRLQNIICAAIPIYDTFAALFGLPAIPLPSFCTAPPTPAPTP